MLNIYNGDATATTARNGEIPGAHCTFRETLITGPTPAGLNEVEWRKLRAAHLSSAYGGSWQEAEKNLERTHAALASYHLHDEVILWFEYDLFCHANLIYLLNWFAERQLGRTKLSLICIGEFPGRPDFHGLGELNGMELASLLDRRVTIGDRELQTGGAAWRAYCSPDPADIEQFLSTDTAALPFIKRALQSHLARFPSVENGLGRIEQQGLALINEGHKKFVDLFAQFGRQEPAYGLGDSQFYLSLQQLSSGRAPLLLNGGARNNKGELDAEKIKHVAFEVTNLGKAVLRGEADFVDMNGIDVSLGGVHLTGTTLWRWDNHSSRLCKAN